VQKAKNNEVASIDKVFDEIKNGSDKLKNWAETHFSDYFFNTKSSEILKNYAKLMKWAEDKKEKYNQNAIDMFTKTNNADAWLIACAMTDKEKFIIVTFEKKDDKIKKRIKIPNVCEEFGIKYYDLYQMLRKMNFKFCIEIWSFLIFYNLCLPIYTTINKYTTVYKYTTLHKSATLQKSTTVYVLTIY